MQRVWLLLVFPQLLESCHHVGSGYRLRLSSDPHPPLNQFLQELLSGVHSAMNQECQDVADQQTFAEGDPQHLVFAQTKALPDPLDGRLMPQQDRAGLLRLLRLLGFHCHRSIMAPGYSACVASDASGR